MDATLIADAVWGKVLTNTETAEDTLTSTFDEAAKGRKLQSNRAQKSLDGRTVTIYDDDMTTVLHVFDISADKNARTPT